MKRFDDPPFKFFVREGTYGLSTDIHLVKPAREDGKIVVAQPAVLEVVDVNMVHPPLFQFSHDEAQPALQSLMDGLWQCGYRPRDIGTAGHLAATEKHLQDFRALVGNFMNVKLPGIEGRSP